MPGLEVLLPVTLLVVVPYETQQHSLVRLVRPLLGAILLRVRRASVKCGHRTAVVGHESLVSLAVLLIRLRSHNLSRNVQVVAREMNKLLQGCTEPALERVPAQQAPQAQFSVMGTLVYGYSPCPVLMVPPSDLIKGPLSGACEITLSHLAAASGLTRVNYCQA